jgi:hypothetical protein
LIDEDPGKTRPKYLDNLTIISNHINVSLKLYFLNPYLEEWILKAYKNSKLNFYNLPLEAKELHDKLPKKQKIQQNLGSLIEDLIIKKIKIF